MAGYLFGGVHGALEAFGGYEVARKAIEALTRAGVERTDQLLTEALLNPELARTLLMKASPGNLPFIAQRLASQLGSLTAVAGTSAASERPSDVQRRSAALPSTKVPHAAVVAPMLKLGMSGGLLGGMAR